MADSGTTGEEKPAEGQKKKRKRRKKDEAPTGEKPKRKRKKKEKKEGDEDGKKKKVDQFARRNIRFVIMLTHPCNLEPVEPHFYIVNLRFTGYGQNMDSRYSLELPQ